MGSMSTPVVTPTLVAPLTAEQRAALPTMLPTWHVDGDMLVRKVPLGFLQAVAVLNDIAVLANEQDHHPDVELAGGQFVVRMTTHDAGGLSARDLKLAAAIDTVLART